jgi:hypothetical protein
MKTPLLKITMDGGMDAAVTTAVRQSGQAAFAIGKRRCWKLPWMAISNTSAARIPG